MVSFFERKWFLWWMFALIVIAHRGQMLSADFASNSLDSSFPGHQESRGETNVE
jgi:hypothetical protein